MSETTGETTAPTKILQLHGGALNAGGTKGNRGGGRPPEEVRQACRDGFFEHLPKALAVLKSRKSTNVERLKALDLLGKYGGLVKTEVERTGGTLEDYLKARRERKRTA
jgi:hypothetical protein